MIDTQVRMSPEFDLLARAACGQRSGARNSIRPDPALNWALALQLAERHRLSPLLDRYIRISQLEAPCNIRAHLDAITLETTARNLILQTELDRIVTMLTANDVPVMALKGSVLARDVYPEIGMRPMLDLDLLVPVPEARRAEALIINLGYRPNPMQSLAQHETMRNTHASGPALVNDNQMVAVDLHRHLSSDCARFDINDVWAHARNGRSAKPGQLALAPEDMVVHVALHFLRDREHRSNGAMGQLADLAWLSTVAAIDWDELVVRVRQWGVGDRVFVALFCANEVLGPVIPVEIVGQLRPATWSVQLARRLIRTRVLGTKPWLSSSYFAGNRPPGHAPSSAPFRRAFPSYEYLKGNYGRADDESYPRLYRRRVARAIPSMIRPWSIPYDQRVGRWLQSLDTDNRWASDEKNL